MQRYEVEIFGVIEKNTELYYFDDRGPYDIRPHLTRFSPMRYWLTVSTGPSLITYVRIFAKIIDLPVHSFAIILIVFYCLRI